MRSILILVLWMSLFPGGAFAQNDDDRDRHRRSIASITVCGDHGTDAGSCNSGFDTHQIVLGPDGGVIDDKANGVHGIADEHSSIFPPGSLQGNRDYLFFGAAGGGSNPDIGVVVLSGGPGPDQNGQWSLDFVDGYGLYPSGQGTVFLAPTTQGHCPIVVDPTATDQQRAAEQDQTFDLDYAAAGSVVKDPTSRPGQLLMIYEGANSCIGNPGGKKTGDGAYVTTGVATSFDNGRTWPSYNSTADFARVPLPLANPTDGPKAPFGAWGSAVCVANECPPPAPPDTYGRYAGVSSPVTLDSLMKMGVGLTGGGLGDSEPSAFVDDASPGPERYVYTVHIYIPGATAAPPFQLPDGRDHDLAIARARLNGGTSRLSFLKWDGQSFARSPGVGGLEAPIPLQGGFENCGDPSQSRNQASISYVDETQQYLLIFVCNSPRDPLGKSTKIEQGSAWFFSTSYDLSDQTRWTTPLEISGTWMPWDTGNPSGSFGCKSYKGWYPTLMSLHREAGHLSTRGYAFYMWGCLGGSDASPPERQFSSRVFTITTSSEDHDCDDRDHDDHGRDKE